MKFYHFEDESGIFIMKEMKRLELSFCHCEEREATDAAIHRVLRGTDRNAGRFLVHSGSPRASHSR